MALYMLDTDIVSHLVRGKSAKLDARLLRTPAGQVCISAVTRGELLFGLALKDGAHRLGGVIHGFLGEVACLAWDADAATAFAGIAASLHRTGTPIGTLDAMIAAHAMSAGAILVTNNERHFSRIEGLEIRNWLK